MKRSTLLTTVFLALLWGCQDPHPAPPEAPPQVTLPEAGPMPPPATLDGGEARAEVDARVAVYVDSWTLEAALSAVENINADLGSGCLLVVDEPWGDEPVEDGVISLGAVANNVPDGAYVDHTGEGSGVIRIWQTQAHSVDYVETLLRALLEPTPKTLGQGGCIGGGS